MKESEPTMRRVVVESPYGTPYPAQLEFFVRYARACLADCLARGETPLASHLLYTQPGVLRDEVPEERRLGIAAGFAWRDVAEATVVYADLGFSTGMLVGIDHARKIGCTIEFRYLGGEWDQLRAGCAP